MSPDDEENNKKMQNFLEYKLPESLHINLYPNGWMSPFDLNVIYNAARRAKGDVLEVGPWLGRSSTALALGLKDREEEDGQAPVLFDIIDFGITSPEEWFDRFDGEKFRVEHDQGRVAEAIFHPGGSNAVLISNLKRNDLLKYTNTIMRGDLLKSPIEKKYSLIFCDALHRAKEIDRTMPKLSTLFAPGAMLVADDVVTEEMAEHVASYLNVKNYFFSRTAVRVRRRKVCVFELE